MDNTIGRVVAVAGSQMTATLEVDALTEDPVRIGAMVKVRSAHLDVIGTIGTINAEGAVLLRAALLSSICWARSCPPPRAGRSSAGA
jgi:hypothetical protein